MSTETKGDVGTNVSLEPSVATEKIVEKSKGFIQDLIKKVTVNIYTAKNVKIGNIIKFLNTNINGVLPLHNILNNLQEVFADGILDLYDVPTIVKIITELLNSNINSELLRNIKVLSLNTDKQAIHYNDDERIYEKNRIEYKNKILNKNNEFL